MKPCHLEAETAVGEEVLFGQRLEPKNMDNGPSPAHTVLSLVVSLHHTSSKFLSDMLISGSLQQYVWRALGELTDIPALTASVKP